MNGMDLAASGPPEWTFFFSSAAAAHRVLRRMRTARAPGCAHLHTARLHDDAAIALDVPHGHAWSEALDVPVLAALAGADVDHIWSASRCPDADLLPRLCRLLRVRAVATNPDEAELVLLEGTGRVRVARGPRHRHPQPGDGRWMPPVQMHIPIPRRPSPARMPRIFADVEDD